MIAGIHNLQNWMHVSFAPRLHHPQETGYVTEPGWTVCQRQRCMSTPSIQAQCSSLSACSSVITIHESCSVYSSTGGKSVFCECAYCAVQVWLFYKK